ncbi:MAG: hypothetical protein GY834_03555 [Bacteroidetes bacterium]|nr:hypothetical protein [Bacteroidota bacterium]
MVLIRNADEAKKFKKWMLKIKNIHIKNQKQMVNAYGKIEALKMDYR